MTRDLASGFLQNLAQVTPDNVLFKERAASVKAAISKATSYEEVEKQLKELHGFDYRIPDLAFEIMQLVFELAQKKAIEPKSFFAKRYIVDIRASTLPILERLAYHIPAQAIPVLWSSLDCGEPTVAEKAAKSLEKIVEYDLEVFPHLGFSVQEEVCAFLSALPKEQLIAHIEATLALCSGILSLEISGSKLTSPDTITLSKGTLPASEPLYNLRAKTIALLKNLYGEVSKSEHKRRILGVLNGITRHSYGGRKTSKELLAQIDKEVSELLDFYAHVIPGADNETLQKLGRNIYWQHYHHSHEYSADVIQKIFAIRDQLYANEELNIFNVLVGFEAVFLYEWNGRDSAEDSVKQEKEYRETKVAEYLQGMNASNYALWEKRILDYSQIESNDLATFIYFGKFVVAAGAKHPEFAKALLAKHSEELRGFRAAVLEGLLDSDNAAATAIITNWLDKGLYLQSIAVVLGHTHSLALEQYEKLLAKAVEQKNQEIIIMVVGALAERYSSEENTLPLIIYAIKELTKYKDSRWVNVYWWRKKLGSIAEILSERDIDVILDNLLHAASIGTHEEWVLAPIAKKYPAEVMAFFKSRIQKREAREGDEEIYEPIPYRFYEKLSGALGEHLGRVVLIAIEWMQEDNLDQKRKAPDLLHAITDEGFEQLGGILIDLYKAKKLDNDTMLRLLNEYAGTLETETVWKALIESNSDDEELRKDCIGHFFGTGMTSGIDGVALAYDARYEMFVGWQSDSNEAIKQVGIEGAKAFKDAAKRERERVQEQQKLREYDFKNQN